jgi:hypothetical protein
MRRLGSACLISHSPILPSIYILQKQTRGHEQILFKLKVESQGPKSIYTYTCTLNYLLLDINILFMIGQRSISCRDQVLQIASLQCILPNYPSQNAAQGKMIRCFRLLITAGTDVMRVQASPSHAISPTRCGLYTWQGPRSAKWFCRRGKFPALQRTLRMLNLSSRLRSRQFPLHPIRKTRR